ncbi:MAG: hypothetical protein ABLT11_02505, partial [Candidatus Acidiferrum sp.]
SRSSAVAVKQNARKTKIAVSRIGTFSKNHQLQSQAMFCGEGLPAIGWKIAHKSKNGEMKGPASHGN